MVEVHATPHQATGMNSGRQLLRHFTPISSSALLSVASTPPESRGVSPRVILLLSWLDADLKHIYKYSEGYHVLYPGADQVIVRFDQKSFWLPTFLGEDNLKPVVEILHDRGIHSFRDPSPGLLVHCLSNGGCFQLVALAELLERPDPLTRFPNTSSSNLSRTSSSPSGMVLVFDSAPGLPSFKIMALAFSVSIKKPWLRIAAYTPLGLSHYLLKLFHLDSIILEPLFRLFGYQYPRLQPFEQMRMQLLDPNLFPLDAPRLYIYSTPDELVYAKDVESHIEDARMAGVETIVAERNEQCAHVTHMRMDPEAYWDSIHKLWLGAQTEFGEIV